MNLEQAQFILQESLRQQVTQQGQQVLEHGMIPVCHNLHKCIVPKL
jgi:hypothetical protein